MPVGEGAFLSFRTLPIRGALRSLPLAPFSRAGRIDLGGIHALTRPPLLHRGLGECMSISRPGEWANEWGEWGEWLYFWVIP